jgi:DNA repair protein RadC
MLLRSLRLQMVSETVEEYRGGDLNGVDEVKVRSADDVFRLFGYLSDLPQEEIHALYLDNKLNLLGTYMVSRGTNNSSAISPADVLKPALLTNASAVILIHNHPSGDLDPSSDDLVFTRKVFTACCIFDIQLSDHLIIAGGKYRSIMNLSGLRI